MDNITEIINDLKNKFNNNSLKNEEKIEYQFNIINLIIEIEHKSNIYTNDLYRNIKVWLNLYIKVLEYKTFTYDEIQVNKIITKIKYLDLEKQCRIISSIIKKMKRNGYNNEVIELINFQRKIDLKYSVTQSGSFISILKNLLLYNLFTLSLFLIFSYVIITYLTFLIQNIESNFSLDLLNIADCEYYDTFLTLISFTFGINGDIIYDNSLELFFLIIVKFYTFLIITYFIVKEISLRIDK
ncbi:hypothetical protein ACOL29_07020 [Aliarcobacter butzleri]